MPQRVFLIISALTGYVFTVPVSAQEVLTWADCLAEAKKNHPDLVSAVESVNQEKAAQEAAASGLFPQTSADLDISRAKTSGTTANSYSYGVSGTQLIFDGMKTFSEIKAASESVAAAEANYRFASTTVRLNLRGAFVNLLKAQELVKVSEEIVKIRRDNLALIRLRYESGLEHRGALLTAEANFAGASFELARAKRNVEFVQRQLTKELGRKEFVPLAVAGDFTARETAVEKPDFDALVRNNPSVLNALARKNAASFGVQSARANFFPTVSGSAGAEKSGATWPPDNDQWNAGVSVSLPLFEGGLKTAQLAQARAAYRQAGADERGARDNAVVGLERTWAALRDALETVDVRRKSLEASEERSRIAQAQYSTGFIAFDDWIIIENTLVEAKKSYLEGQADALLAEAAWVQAKGETLEYAP
ncbi:MAG TPA: TolC family protein [Candidatus Omnitrophica bacterium]|nr:TolC family protein [Candidatus Omnitrophota bacterium]